MWESFVLCLDPVDFYSEPKPRTVDKETAKAFGLSRYFTGRFCKNGHIAWRRLSQSKCTECERMYSKTWSQKNQEKRSEIYQRYRRNNQKVIKKRMCDYYNNNKSAYAERRIKRRKRCKEAVPKWADHEKIKQIYDQCSYINDTTGVSHEVDHIVPLQGEYVCGLHVHWNLQVIPAVENRAKSNKFDLDYDSEITLGLENEMIKASSGIVSNEEGN